MSLRRVSAVLVTAALAVATVSLAAPTYAAETPQLLGATSSVDTVSVPAQISTVFRLAGDVTSVAATWSAGTGINQQTQTSGAYQVNAGQSTLEILLAQKSWMQAGQWTLVGVTVTGRSGTAPVVYGAGGQPLPGPAATFTLTTGPASLVAMGDATGLISDAHITSPAVDPKTITTSGDLKATVAYSGSTTGAAFHAIYQLGATPHLRGLNATAPGPSGSLVVGELVNFTTLNDGVWSLVRVTVNQGPAVRVFDKDGYRTYVQTTFDPLGNGPLCGGYFGDVTSATLPAGCRLVSSSTTPAAGFGDPSNVVTVTGMGAAHLTSPTLSNATVSSSSVAAGGTVTVSAHFSDPEEGPKVGEQLSAVLEQGAYQLTAQYSPSASCIMSFPVQCTVSADIHVPADAPSGLYTARWFYSVNARSNGSYYGPEGFVTHIAGRDTTTALPAEWASLRGLTLTVTGGVAADTTPPVLTSITRTSPTQVDTTDQVATPNAAILHWTGSDVGTGIQRVAATLYSPATQGYAELSWAPTSPAVNGTSGDIDIASYYAGVGDWVVRAITVSDRRGNTRTYDADGTVQPGTTHTFDLASLGFTVLNATAAAVPSPPRALKVSGRDATLVASWTPPASVGGSPVTGYDVTLQPGTIVQHVTTPSATFTGLTNDVGYTVSVVAKNTQGAGPMAWAPSVWVHKVAPLVGPTLAAVAPVLRTTALTVKAVAPAPQAGAPVTGYLTQWRVAPAGSPLPTAWKTLGAKRSAPSTTVAVSAGTRVCLRVVAVNLVGAGTASNVRCSVVMADERVLAASGAWKRTSVASAYKRTLSTSVKAGASLTMARAYGTRIVLAGRAVPKGGTIAVYVGTRRVAVLSFSAAKAAYVVRSVTVALRGQKLTFKVLTPGKGVSLDGIAIIA